MAAQTLTNVQLFVGAAELSQFSGSFDISAETEMKEANNFAANGYRIVIPGQSSFTTSIGGNSDFATGAVNETFTPTAIGDQYATSIIYNGTAAVAGDPAWLMRGGIDKLGFVAATPGEIAQFAISLTSDAAGVDGVVGAPLASRGTGGLTGTAVAMAGPTADQRLWAALHVTAASGTNLVVKVQSDNAVGFPSSTDRITFSTMSAVGWQFLSVPGSFVSETHHRVTAAISSGTFSFAVLMGVR